MSRDIKIQDYTYHLPEDKIAKTPLSERSDSKLLVYKQGIITDFAFKSIPSLLPPNSTLVFNNTKVVSARILFDTLLKKGKPIEIFILEPVKGISIETAMLQKGKSKWLCLIGNNRDFTTDYLIKTFDFENNEYTLKAHKPIKLSDVFEVEFEWNGNITFAEILNLAGIIPLPPYLKRIPDENDKTRYQTIYAKQEGSVAAPTAGLHFSKDVLNDLEKNNISTEFVVLHVGAGTFKPVKSMSMKDHEMHSEEIIVSKSTLHGMLKNSENLFAVGTTSLRTLESLFWIGLKLSKGINNLQIHQWDAYDLEIPSDFNYKIALEAVLNYMEKNKQDCLKTKTQLLIAPGYMIRSVKGLITNFHQPNSTLLLLIAALVGNDWRKIYNHALANNYRFLSYGDSSLLIPK
jgi:S-adenosylmethionine:tRNA ribosyltransferase-isomerase